MHRLNIAFVNELERRFQRRRQVNPGLFIDPKVVYCCIDCKTTFNSLLQSETMRRRNRMRTESAAAIAAMRSTIYVDSLDMAADNSNGIGMLGNAGHISRNIVPEPEVEVEDFGSEVIFNERTVL